MAILQNFNKHLEQIKKGGILVIVKKLRTIIYQCKEMEVRYNYMIYALIIH